MHTLVMIAAAALTVAPIGNVRFKGPYGKLMDQMIRNHVMVTDAEYLANVFRYKTESRWWQTEFWGKYMHSSVPFAQYANSSELREKISRSVEVILSSQEPAGYIGNYPNDKRMGNSWDVWGCKYTLMGLLHWYDGTGDQKALNAARKLCDYIIGELGPDGKRGYPLYKSGEWSGMPSSSILEPVMWLYNRTKEQKYLDFATYIVKGMTEPEEGPRLLDLALQGVHVADRNIERNDGKGKFGYVMKVNRRKAYEMLSCYQGLIEYYEVTHREELLKAAIMTVDDVIAEEINLAGGAGCDELWYHGRSKQNMNYSHPQETCVTTTWMRILEKLLVLTGDPKYADQLERSFYNVYLASMRPGATEFAAYTPLNGSRGHCHDHCAMHTDCCNANGPRGYLSFLRGTILGDERRAVMNFYVSGAQKIALGKSGVVAEYDVYSLYPRTGSVRIINRTDGDFTLALRIPAFAAKSTVKINNRAITEPITAGKYLELRREWKCGDVIDLNLDMAVKVHLLNHYAAFTYGPILLARDNRFNDGPIDEDLRYDSWNKGDTINTPQVTVSRVVGDEIRMEFSVKFGTLGIHTENPEGKLPSVVKMCDYASAGNLWRSDNAYRVWFPVQYRNFE